MAFDVRRVVTGHDEAGRPVIRADGPPPLVEAPTGVAVGELLWLDAAPVGVDDGRDRTEGGFPLEPPPGGLSVRVIRLPPPSPGTGGADQWVRVAGDDPAEPGVHSTDTLDFVPTATPASEFWSVSPLRLLGMISTTPNRSGT